MIKIFEKFGLFKKLCYLCPQNYEDSRIRQSESNDNRTRRHPVDLLAGHLFYNESMSNQRPRTIDEQIRLLRSRGMAFGNEEEAKQCLAHISYFRLKYYWTDMRDEETEHDFKEGALFDDVIARYNFDRRLRLILFDAIEIIEVALRAKIINHLSHAKDSGLWYLDDSLFERKDYYEDFVLDLKYEFDRSTEPFAKEYIAEHAYWDWESMEGDNPDAWMILESATFGTLSKMYKNLKSQLPERAAIANDFGLYSAKELSSWLEAISVLRNIIAHHSRLWNRSLAKQVTNPKGHRDKWLQNPLTDNQKKKPYGVISAMLYLCNAVYPDNQIKDKLLALIDHSTNIPYYKYGFVGDWRKEPIWR